MSGFGIRNSSDTNQTPIRKKALVKGRNKEAVNFGRNFQGHALKNEAPLMIGSLEDNFSELFTAESYNTVFVDMAAIWSARIKGIKPKPLDIDYNNIQFDGRIALLLHGDQSGKFTLITKTDERLSYCSVEQFAADFVTFLEINGLKAQVEVTDVLACNVCETEVLSRKWRGKTMMQVFSESLEGQFDHDVALRAYGGSRGVDREDLLFFKDSDHYQMYAYAKASHLATKIEDDDTKLVLDESTAPLYAISFQLILETGETTGIPEGIQQIFSIVAAENDGLEGQELALEFEEIKREVQIVPDFDELELLGSPDKKNEGRSGA
jgi:hypothetical protein